MRRLGPTWLRGMTTEALHGLGGRLLRDYEEVGLSARQDWLLDRLSHELCWRMSKRLPQDRCTCRLCLEPWVRLLEER